MDRQKSTITTCGQSFVPYSPLSSLFLASQLLLFSYFSLLCEQHVLPSPSFFHYKNKKNLTIPNHISKVAKDFILKLLMKNTKCRLGAKGVQHIEHHPFFESDMD